MPVVVFIALRQLWDRKLLNGIAVGGVVLGIVTLIGVRGIMNGFEGKFIHSILKISPHITLLDNELRPAPPMLARFFDDFVAAQVSHQSPADRQLRIKRPEELARTIERIDGVVAASGSLLGSAVIALGAREYSVEVRGIEPLQQERVTPISGYVKQGSLRALASETNGVLLGSGVAKHVGAKPGDVLTCSSPRGERMNLKVVGIFDAEVPPIDNVRIYVSLRSAQVLLGRPDAVARIEVKLADPDRAPALTERFEKMFGYDAESWQEANANFLGIFRMQDTITQFVVGAILAVGGFGILAIQVMIVLQKTRDIAILRSVGFRRNDILIVFLLQGTTIALVGGALGDLLGHYLITALGKLKTHQEGLVRSEYFLVSDEPSMYIYGFLFALIVGLIASLIPAIRGSKVEPVDVLRGQLG
jgi:lipoprotein-releasing system permease protein